MGYAPKGHRMGEGMRDGSELVVSDVTVKPSAVADKKRHHHHHHHHGPKEDWRHGHARSSGQHKRYCS